MAIWSEYRYKLSATAVGRLVKWLLQLAVVQSPKKLAKRTANPKAQNALQAGKN